LLCIFIRIFAHSGLQACSKPPYGIGN
jgi:hypothetical protein